jgi:hypothetical protein
MCNSIFEQNQPVRNHLTRIHQTTLIYRDQIEPGFRTSTVQCHGISRLQQLNLLCIGNPECRITIDVRKYDTGCCRYAFCDPAREEIQRVVAGDDKRIFGFCYRRVFAPRLVVLATAGRNQQDDTYE